MARVAIYLRVSSIGQEENYSLPGQEEDCRNWCTANGHTVVKVYNDGAQHSWTLNRPGLDQMFLDAKMDEFDILLIGRYDRLSRDIVQQNVVVYQLGMYKKQVTSASQPLPEDRAMAELMRNLHGYAAQAELNAIRLRTTGGRKRRMRDGKLLVGTSQLYGYRWANPDVKHGKDAYVIDPETAPVVQLIYDLLVANGRSLRFIAAELERRGIPTPGQVLLDRGQLAKGRTVSSIWRLSTLRRILTNPAYIGKHTGWRHTTEEVMRKDKLTGELRAVRYTRLREEDDPDRVAYDASVCPPIISDAVFNAAQIVLRRNKEEAARRMKDPKAALLRNGFAICGHCGRKIQVKFHKQNSHYRYMCAAEQDLKSVHCPGGGWSMKAADLDAIVWGFVVRAFENPDIIRAAFERYKEKSA
ncbi:MAG TPA: recombinase family protein, partial [Candidatus Saccharimonadales bacterium]|nr:recombinase family protein [Candidatus Saccharimonadales bacterium]